MPLLCTAPLRDRGEESDGGGGACGTAEGPVARSAARLHSEHSTGEVSDLSSAFRLAAFTTVVVLALSGCGIPDFLPIPKPPGSIDGLVTVGEPPDGFLTLTVFAGVQDGQRVSIRSTVTQVQVAAGTTQAPFSILSVEAGTYSVFAFADADGDSVVEAGEWFGRADNVVVNAGQTKYGVVVAVSRYNGTPLEIR